MLATAMFKMALVASVFIAVVSSVYVSPTFSQECDDYSQYLQQIGSWIGGRDCDVEGDLACTVSGSVLTVWDLTDPAHPVERGSLSAREMYSVDIWQNLAIVVEVGYQVKVADIRFPDAPVWIGGVADTYAQRVNVHDGIAYVSRRDGKLRLLDVGANPLFPPELAMIDLPSEPHEVFVGSGRAYVPFGRTVKIVDVTNPSQPSDLEQFETSKAAWALRVVGDWAFVACLGSFEVVDLAAVGGPTQRATIDIPWDVGNPNPVYDTDLDVLDNVVLFGNPSHGALIDVAQPTTPSLLSVFDGSGLYVSWLDGGLSFSTGGRLYATGTGTWAPVDGSAYPLAGSSDLVASGTTIIEMKSAVLRTFDATVPGLPVLLDQYDLSPRQGTWVLFDDYVVFGLASSGVAVLDISNPADVAYHSIIPTDYAIVLEVEVVGTTLYIVSQSTMSLGSLSLQALDVSDMSVPQPLGSYTDPSWSNIIGYADVNVHGEPDYALVSLNFLAATGSTQETVVLGTTALPSFTELSTLPGWATTAGSSFLTISGYTYVMGSAPGTIDILDLSDPTDILFISPDEVRNFRFGSRFVNAGSYLYSHVGLIADVSNPTDPRPVGQMSGVTGTPAVVGELLYSTDSTGSLSWSRLQCGAAPAPPQAVSVAYSTSGNTISWGPALRASLPMEAFHRVYRSSVPDFVPGPDTLVREEPSNSWFDSEGTFAHHYLVTAVSADGLESAPVAPTAVTDAPTAARDQLYLATPNPFNPRTTISYSLRAPGDAELVIYDLAGRRVKTLVSGHIEAGPHDAQWDGLDEQGRRVASGVYLYRLVTGQFSETRRMVLLK